MGTFSLALPSIPPSRRNFCCTSSCVRWPGIPLPCNHITLYPLKGTAPLRKCVVRKLRRNKEGDVCNVYCNLPTHVRRLMRQVHHESYHSYDGHGEDSPKWFLRTKPAAFHPFLFLSFCSSFCLWPEASSRSSAIFRDSSSRSSPRPRTFSGELKNERAIAAVPWNLVRGM